MKINWGLFLRGIAAVAVGLFMASAQAKPPFGEGWGKHDQSRGKGWVRYTMENADMVNVLGADDKLHTATCSGYPGTDSEFSFWSKKGKSENLAVFFEGGGACWDATTCSFPIADPLPPGIPAQLQFFVPAIDPKSTPADYSGLFDADHPDNPIRDWSIVYIPYCTGDLHTGSATKTYSNAGNPYIATATFPIKHNGFDNFMVVLDWMKKNVQGPKNVLVTGSSAGGYGAIANFPWIERTYRNAHTNVIADASQGVTTPGFDKYGRTSWNMQLAPWAFGNAPSAIAGPDLLRTAAKARPNVKTAQFTTAYDETQISFYGYMAAYYGFAGSYGGGGTCNNFPLDWHNQMIGTLLSYADNVPNFRYYLAEGSYHTLMRSPLFYTENTAGVNFSKWVGDMLANRGGTRSYGGGWKNAASAASLSQQPCPPL